MKSRVGIAGAAAWTLAGLVVVLGIAYVALYVAILSYPFRRMDSPGPSSSSASPAPSSAP